MLTSYDLGGDDGDGQAEDGALLWCACRVLQEDGRVTEQDLRRPHGVVRQHRDGRGTSSRRVLSPSKRGMG